MAADEIERFRLEIVERSRDARAGDNITDQELLREVMNTVGKPGQLHDALASEMPLRKGAAGSGLVRVTRRVPA